MSDMRGPRDAFFDGELTPEQERELADWLAADPANIRTFVLETCLHRSTRDILVARRLVEAMGNEPGVGACARAPRPRGARLAWVAAAACIAAVAGAIALSPGRRSVPAPGAPAVVRTVEVPRPDPGRWNLRVNVVPFAEVALVRGDEPMTTEFTPVGIEGLEVGRGPCRVELCWPSRENARVRLTETVEDPRHGETVTISGDMSKAEILLERR